MSSRRYRRLLALATKAIGFLHRHLSDDAEVTIIVRDQGEFLHLCARGRCPARELTMLRECAKRLKEKIEESN